MNRSLIFPLSLLLTLVAVPVGAGSGAPSVLGVYEGTFHLHHRPHQNPVRQFARLEITDQQGDHFTGVLLTSLTDLAVTDAVEGTVSSTRRVLFHVDLEEPLEGGLIRTSAFSVFGRLSPSGRELKGQWSDSLGNRGPIRLRRLR